jgi:GNAT superfamily N-acetyltransferase
LIRPARSDDLSALIGIELAAGDLFRGIGMDAVADDDPPTLADLAVFQQHGRMWVATNGDDEAVSYIVVEVIDDGAHIEQVSVHPDHSRRGLGRALIDTVDAWAGSRALSRLTLTTYADVPWNAPSYARLGFTVLADGEQSDWLRRVRDHESGRGLARWPRVVMSRPVPPGP